MPTTSSEGRRRSRARARAGGSVLTRREGTRRLAQLAFARALARGCRRGLRRREDEVGDLLGRRHRRPFGGGGGGGRARLRASGAARVLGLAAGGGLALRRGRLLAARDAFQPALLGRLAQRLLLRAAQALGLHDALLVDRAALGRALLGLLRRRLALARRAPVLERALRGARLDLGGGLLLGGLRRAGGGAAGRLARRGGLLLGLLARLGELAHAVLERLARGGLGARGLRRRVGLGERGVDALLELRALGVLLGDPRRRAAHVLQRLLEIAAERALLRREALDLGQRPVQRGLELALHLGVLVGALVDLGARRLQDAGQPLDLRQRALARVGQLGELGEGGRAVGAEGVDLRERGGAGAPEALEPGAPRRARR